MYLIVDKLPQQYLTVNKCKFRGGKTSRPDLSCNEINNYNKIYTGDFLYFGAEGRLSCFIHQTEQIIN